jgi:hypothetical protein
LAGHRLPITTPEHAILHKLRVRKQGANERHLRDVRSMLRVLGDSIDLAGLERDAATLALSVQWMEMEALRD